MSHGQGKSYHNNGTLYYDGQWENNLSHGQGKSYREDGSLEYDGQWEDMTKKYGQGKFYHKKWTNSIRWEMGKMTKK